SWTERRQSVQEIRRKEVYPVPKTQDPFASASTPAALPARYVSTTTVDVGEGLRLEVTRFEVVPDRFATDGEEPKKFGEITGIVLESGAPRFADGQECVVTCRNRRLEALANEVPEVGNAVTIVRNEDVGKTAGWGYRIEPSAN